MGKRIFVTGAKGFVGRWVESYVGQHQKALTWATPEDAYDIRDLAALRARVDAAQPDWIIHLAAQSSVPASFVAPRETFEVNLAGTLTLLTVLKETGFRGRLLLVSSADAYGSVPESALPVAEDRQLAPRSPYAVSKAATELLCRQWHYIEGLDVVIARPFNHIGPGQSADFVISSFAKQISEIELGRCGAEIAVGDIETTRDFTDVRDVVRAYFFLLHGGETGQTYNVCSGQEQRIRVLLERMLLLGGIKAVIRVDPHKLRVSEQRRMFGSNQRIAAATGWAPQIELDTTLRDVLKDWKKRIIYE